MPRQSLRSTVARAGTAAVLAAGVALGVAPAAAAAATPSTIRLAPNPATGTAGQATAFTVSGRASDGSDLGDVTATSTLSITPDGSCTTGSCTPARPGQHTVTAVNGSARTTAVLRVPDQLPVAGGDAYSTDAGVTLTVPAPGVLGNDSDPDPGDTLTARPVSSPEHGRLTLAADGSFTYVPDAGFSGPDTFTYVASDGRTNGISAPATVRITVGPPAATGITLNPARSTGAVGVAQPYTVTQQPGDVDVTATTTLTIAPDGTCTVGACTPDRPGAHTVTARTGSLADFATLDVADRLPVAMPDDYSVRAGQVLTVPAPGVLGNDTDADDDPLTAVQPTQAAHGTVSLALDGSFVYTPAAGYAGPDQFTYSARDGRPRGLSAPTTVTITVAPAIRVTGSGTLALDTESYQFSLDLSATGAQASGSCRLTGSQGTGIRCTGFSDVRRSGNQVTFRGTALYNDRQPISFTATVVDGAPDSFVIFGAGRRYGGDLTSGDIAIAP